MITPQGPSLAERQVDDIECLDRESSCDGFDELPAAILATVHEFEVKLENKRYNLTVITPEAVLEAIKKVLLRPV